MSILYAICALFWLILGSSLVNITDFILWNVSDFILIDSKLLFSSWFCTVSSSVLCISCMHLSAAHSHSLELQHTTLKWVCLLHVFPNARHCLWLCGAPQYLQLSILSFLFCYLYCCLLSFSVLLQLCM